MDVALHTPRAAGRASLLSLEAKLAAIDWDFPKSSTTDALNNIHPYPAKFIPEIPRGFIRALGVPSGTAVLDPFCGSGTTLIEAQRNGLPSVGIDLNPIACLIARVKTELLPSGLLETAQHCVHVARRDRSPQIPPIPALDHWFRRDIQNTLAALGGAIRAVTEAHLRDALSLCLSSIIVRVSNQDSDTRYAAVKKSVAPETVYDLFMGVAMKATHALHRTPETLAPARVLQRDVLDVRAAEIGLPVGLVVTSPPYPNAYEYWLYHKYRMWWLGFDPLWVKSREIGARAHYFTKHAPTPDDFAASMRATLALVDAVLVPGGHVCMVIGRSKVHGEIIDNARIVRDVAETLGYRLVFRKDRVLAPGRKSFNLSHANIRTEAVLVLAKDR